MTTYAAAVAFGLTQGWLRLPMDNEAQAARRVRRDYRRARRAKYYAAGLNSRGKPRVRHPNYADQSKEAKAERKRVLQREIYRRNRPGERIRRR